MTTEPPRPYYIKREPLIIRMLKETAKYILPLQPDELKSIEKPSKSNASKQIINQ